MSATKSKRVPKSGADKYLLYQNAVQSPSTHVDWLLASWRDLRREAPLPRLLREDFCGTFAISCEWVKRDARHTSLGLDLDPEPLTWGRRHNLAALDRSQRARVDIRQENVLTRTRPGADLIYAGNFSFFIFHERLQLLDYFRVARDSLSKNGLLVLEMAGGPGMIAPVREKKTVRLGKDHKYQYIWHQKSFDPIQNRGHYAIHFRDESGMRLDDAFTYDWRLWSVPEIRDLLRDAGFSKSVVYWEKSVRGEGTGDYVPMEEGDNAYSWIAYVVGVR